MSNTYRTVDNPGTGETITFVETSHDSGGARVVALITMAPGGAVTPHSHQVKETIECVEGAFTIHLEGRDMAFPAGAAWPPARTSCTASATTPTSPPPSR